MTSAVTSVNDYMIHLPEDRKAVMQSIRETILQNLPKGFEETISYGMIGYVVPHSIYPAGYHCDPKLPLPFLSIASQKNFVAVYHMGMYADKKLMEWFTTGYGKVCKQKLDMGKSCVRFKKMNDIPVEFLGKLAAKMSTKEWIDLYEKSFRKKG